MSRGVTPYRVRRTELTDEIFAEILRIDKDCFHRLDKLTVNRDPAWKWWLAIAPDTDLPVGFANLRASVRGVPGRFFLGRCAVLEAHRKQGLQGALLRARIRYARAQEGAQEIHTYTESSADGCPSARNLVRAGFLPFWPQDWCASEAIHWRLRLFP